MAQLKDLLVAGNARIIGESSFNDNVTVNGILTGDGSNLTNLNASNIASGTLNANRLPNSGVTASSYGPSANATPAHSGSFSVPYFTVDAHGRITSASTKTITLPSDNNTDTKVTQTITNLNASYPLLLAPSGQTTTATTTAYFDSGITLNPEKNIITGAKLEYNYTSAPTQPDAVIKVGSSNFDVNIFKVFDYATGYKADGGGYGYSLMYNGTGEGIGNALTLYCDNQGSASKVIGWQLNQSGQMGIKTSANSNYSLYVDGASYFKGAITTTGVTSITNTTASTNKSSGALKVSGGAGIAGRMSANEVMVADEVTLQYDSTLKAMKFVF
jgi:hypothetical protein